MTLSPEEMEAVKPCPFCGGKAELERKGTARQSNIVVCENCGCRVESGDVFEPWATWNRREPGASALAARGGERAAVASLRSAAEIGLRELQCLVTDARDETGWAAIRALREALAASPSPSSTAEAGWRDIASAPRDGTPVLLYRPLGRIYTKKGGYIDTPLEPLVFIGSYSEETGWWRKKNPRKIDVQPTHWRPLPVPPATEQGARGPTEKHPDRPCCKDDQSCCDFVCGN